MLKKHNKLIVFLVLAAFMFSVVGSAGAASFSDVTGTDVESAAIYKLTSLGIIDGYPDGTFGPEKTITRAEFAKIAVYTAGLQAVANGMQGTPSSFNDVSSDFWANGWINVAAAQGFVKGYPDGTFKPQAQITQAEVITVLLRLLGYNDNLPGNWPANYIAKAANLKVLDDISFIANKAATRGEVAILGSETLNQFKVEYKAADNVFGFVQDPNSNNLTLLEDKFDSTIYEDKLAQVVNYPNGNWEVAFYDGTVARELAEDAVVTGAPTIYQAENRFVDFILNDDNEIVFLEVKDYGVITADEIEITQARTASNDGKIKISGKTYNFASDLYGSLAAAVNVTGKQDTADKYQVTLDEDGKVAIVRNWTANLGSVVDYVANDRIYLKDNAAVAATTNFSGKDILVRKDLKPASLSDIEENDTVWIYANSRGADYFVDARSSKVTGTLQSAQEAAGFITELVIDGTTYDVVQLPSKQIYFSLDGGEEWESTMLTASDLEDNNLYGTTVTLLTTVGGTAMALLSEGVSADAKMYGMVTSISTSPVVKGTKEAALVTVLRDDDEEYAYPVYADTLVSIGGAAGAKLSTFAGAGIAAKALTALSANDLVHIVLDADGLVDKVETYTASSAIAAADLNSDLNTIRVGGTWMTGKEAVFFNQSGTNVVKWSEVKDSRGIAGGGLLAYYADGNVLKYAVVNDGSLASAPDYALVTFKGIDADGRFVNILVDNEVQKYYEVTGITISNFVKGDMIEFNLVGGKIDVTKSNSNSDFTTVGYVDQINLSNNTIKVDVAGTVFSYILDPDETLVFDASDTDNLVQLNLKDIARNEYVNINVTDGVLDFITIIDEPSTPVAPPVVEEAIITASAINNAIATDKINVKLTAKAGEDFSDYSVVVYNADNTVKFVGALAAAAEAAAGQDILLSALGFTTAVDANKSFTIKVLRVDDLSELATKTIMTGALF
jgi:hypothetical protein